MNIYALVKQELNQTVLTLDCKRINNKYSKWQVTLNAKWPETISFTMVDKNKSTAYKNVALKCLFWLEMNGKVRNGKPIMYSKEEMKKKQLKAIELSITPNILNEMKELIKTYNTVIYILHARVSYIIIYNILICIIIISRRYKIQWHRKKVLQILFLVIKVPSHRSIQSLTNLL